MQTTVVVMPDVTERFPCFLGDLLHSESLEISQVQHALLHKTEGLETPLNDLPGLVRSRNACPFGQHCVLDGGNVRARIEMPDLQLLSPVHASMISVAQDPHFSSAARRIELCRHFVDFHENVLHHVCRFAYVVKYFQSDMEHQTMIAIK